MLDDFLLRAVLAGFGVVLAAGPLGCFVVWRRMAYFGEATAHAAILGVAISLAFSLSIFAGVFLLAMAMAVAVGLLSGRELATDTLLGVLSHTALAAGLVAVSFLSSVRVDLMGYLFGDILSVTKTEVGLIWGGALVILAGLTWRWNALLTATLNEEMAAAQGINTRRENLVLMISLALLVAIAIKIVGALLITAMLIIPAATGRLGSKTPEAMAVLSVLCGALSVVAGLTSSMTFDTPAGPSIIIAAAGFFAVVSIFSTAKR